MIHKKKGIFITATGTDVGKTYVTALILKKLREASVNAGYYKAVHIVMQTNWFPEMLRMLPPYQVYLSLLNNWYLTSMNLQFPHIWQHNWKNVQLI